MSSQIRLNVEFTGGLEMLFSNERKHNILIPAESKSGRPSNVADLIDWLCTNLMTDSRKDMFVLDDTVRPGILVLVNNSDWELEGQEDYELQQGDDIVFVSTLHGG